MWEMRHTDVSVNSIYPILWRGENKSKFGHGDMTVRKRWSSKSQNVIIYILIIVVTLTLVAVFQDFGSLLIVSGNH